MGTLDDRDLAADIALLGDVMAAVASADHELTEPEVDEVLGVQAPPVADPADAEADPTPDPTPDQTPGPSAEEAGPG